MFSSRDLDLRIDELAFRLPVKRQQLKSQTGTLTTVLRNKLTSPEAFAVATLSGAGLGLWLQKRDAGLRYTLADGAADILGYWKIFHPDIWSSLWRALVVSIK